MARNITDEKLNVDMQINGGNEAQAALGKLERAQQDLVNTNKDLRLEKAKLAAQNKKSSQEYKNLTKAISYNNTKIKLNKAEQAKQRKEIGITGLTMRQLVKEYRNLRSQMNSKTFGTDEWKKLNAEAQQYKGRINEIGKEMRGTRSTMNSTNASIIKQTKNWAGLVFGITGFIAIIQAALGYAKEFITDARNLALEAKGVEFAFKRLGDEGEDAFNRVKQSTRGLLSELEIKKSLVEFDNFNLSLKEADTLFEFLAVRATQTGQSVDKLKDSLVEGLSKESKLRIDNLGISASELNAELDKTPDFVQAVANIAKREVAEAGDILDEAANGAQRWTANMENLKLAIGQLFSSGDGLGLIGFFADQIERITNGVKILKTGLIAVRIGFNQILTPIKQMLTIFPGLSDGLGQLMKLFTTPGITTFSIMMIKIGATLGGLSNTVKTLKNEFIGLLGTFKAFQGLEIDLLNPAKTFKSINNFDFKGAFAKIEGQFKESGKNLKGAFSEGYQGVLDEVKKENDRLANQGAETGDPNTGTNSEEAEKRKEALASLEEKYLKEREERLATSNEAMAQLNRDRAIAEAEELQASQKLMDLIKAEHAVKIEEARIQDEEVELQKMRDFEARKRELLNQLALEKATSDQEKEELALEQKFIKQEEDLQRDLENMVITEEQKTELMKLLTEQREIELADIKEKYYKQNLDREKAFKKELINAEHQFLQAKSDRYKAGVQILKSFFGQSSDMLKGIFLLEKALAINDIIINASKSIALAKANFASVPAIIPGTILPNPGFPVAFAHMTTGIADIKLSAATNIASIVASTVQGFEDGLYPITRTDGKTFNAAYGGGTKTQVVKRPTYFNDYLTGEAGPEMIIDNATFKRLDPQIVNHILTVNRGVRGFQDGFYPQQNPTATPQQNQELSQMRDTIVMLGATVSRLSEQLDQGIVAKTYYGYEDEIKRQDVQKDIERSTKNGTLAS